MTLPWLRIPLERRPRPEITGPGGTTLTDDQCAASVLAARRIMREGADRFVSGATSYWSRGWGESLVRLRDENGRMRLMTQVGFEYVLRTEYDVALVHPYPESN